MSVVLFNYFRAKNQKENQTKEKEKEKTEAVNYSLLEEELLNQEFKIKVQLSTFSFFFFETISNGFIFYLICTIL